jgi:hemolysin III
LFPSSVSRLGLTAPALLFLGGALYTIGAIIYARRSPDPRPAVFGYHEIFHALVIAAAFLHYGAVATVVA